MTITRVTSSSRSGLVLALIGVSVGLTAAFAGCATAPEGNSTPYYEPVVAKADYLQGLHEDLSKELCDEGKIFRTCYPLSESDCQSQAKQAEVVCENDILPTMPEALNSYQAKQWGGRIGKCTGESLGRVLNANFLISKNEECTKQIDDI